MRHGVAADHHRDVGRRVERPRMRECAVAPARQNRRQIFVLAYSRVPVIASHPEMHFCPAPVAFGVGADLRDRVVHDAHSITGDLRVLSGGVRCLVDAGEGDEGVSRPTRSKSQRDLFPNLTIDRQPAAHVAAEVSRRGARHETGTLSDALATAQAATDHAQRTQTRLRQLENRRRRTIDVPIDEAHLRSDVASRMSGEPRDAVGAIVPAQARQTDASRISSHDERRVGWSGD